MLGKREKRLALIVLMALVAYVADRIVLTPMLDAWRQDGERVAELQQQLATANGLAAAVAGWRDEKARRKELAFPAERAEAENEALTILANGTVARKLRLKSIRPAWREAGSTAKGAPAQLELLVSADGTLAAVAGFLYDMETHSAPIRVARTRIQSRGENGRALDMDLTLTMLTAEEHKEDDQ